MTCQHRHKAVRGCFSPRARGRHGIAGIVGRTLVAIIGFMLAVIVLATVHRKQADPGGANRVVLPTHIGAERIAEMILFPETSRMLRTSMMFSALERSLRGLGLDMAVLAAPEKAL
jgi:hypothetical protein